MLLLVPLSIHQMTQIHFQNQVVFFHFTLHFIVGCLYEPLDGAKIGFHFTEKEGLSDCQVSCPVFS